jgi:Fur family ferric uptake transcriptional regulator
VSKAVTSSTTNARAPGAIGQRSTRQRAAVAGVLQDVDDFRSAQDLHEMLTARGERVGLATVYRSLQAMAEIGDIDVLNGVDGQSLYRRCGQRSGHHHHLMCRECGLTVEVKASAVERWTNSIAAEHGFSEVSHTLDVFGVCNSCSRQGHSRQG